MQERVTGSGDVEPISPSWYLTRDGQQFGPLTDRELSVFADGGNFKPGDLLWTEGLDSWKPAESLFSSEPAPEADEPEVAGPELDEPEFATFGEDAGAPAGLDASLDASLEADGADAAFAEEAVETDADFAPGPEAFAQSADEPRSADVSALVQALTEPGEAEPSQEASLKDKTLNEFKQFSGLFYYLWTVLIALLLHGWVAGSEGGIGIGFIVLMTINAFFASKVMPRFDQFGFAEGLKQKPLIYSAIYHAAAFTTLMFAAYILEALILALFLVGGYVGPLGWLPGGSLLATWVLWVVLGVAFLPYFAYRALEGAVGADELHALVFGRKTQ